MVYHLYSRRRKEYLRSSGAYLDGHGMKSYTHWTPYIDRAQSFASRKAAKNMRRLLLRKKRESAIITDGKGEPVWDI